MTSNLTTQYLQLLADCLQNGNNAIGRNGLVRKLWSPTPLVVESVDEDFPLLQDRPHAFYKSILETLFFLSGDSSYESMPEVLKTSWWKPWAAQAHDQKSWGRFYGAQWRAQVTETEGVFFDPLQHLLEQLRDVVVTEVENRKMVVSLWHTPDTLSAYTRKPAVLESCHSTCLVFDLEASPAGWSLNMHHTQRSLDIVNGTAADLIYSGLLMNFIADWLSSETRFRVFPGKLVYAPINVHIYENHWVQVQEHLERFSPSSMFFPVGVSFDSNILAKVLSGDLLCKTIPEAKAIAKVSLEPPLEVNPPARKLSFTLNA